MYGSNFVDWKNQKHLHERRPEYPVYSLPFKGVSAYKKDYNKEKAQKGIDIKMMERSNSQINANKVSKERAKALLGVQKPEFATTNQNFYQAFEFRRSQECSQSPIRSGTGSISAKQMAELNNSASLVEFMGKEVSRAAKKKDLVTDFSGIGHSRQMRNLPIHFETHKRQEFNSKEIRGLQLDHIPYP